MSDLIRFRDIVSEEENVKEACPACHKIMVPIKFVRSMEMLYCEDCDVLRPRGDTDGNSTPAQNAIIRP